VSSAVAPPSGDDDGATVDRSRPQRVVRLRGVVEAERRDLGPDHAATSQLEDLVTSTTIAEPRLELDAVLDELRAAPTAVDSPPQNHPPGDQ